MSRRTNSTINICSNLTSSKLINYSLSRKTTDYIVGRCTMSGLGKILVDRRLSSG